MKRIIAIILAFILAAGGTSVFAAEEGSFNQRYYKEAIGLLNALGIVSSESGTLIEKDISRIELLKTVINAMTNNGVDGYSETLTGYSDVPQASMGYIDYALSMGMIFPGQHFNPDEPADISFAQMVMTGAAGYKIEKRAFARAASDIGISENVRADASKSLKMGDAYVMVYNLLANVRLSRITDAAYAIHDSSILSSVYKISSVKAKLIADSCTAADGIICDKGFVRVKTLTNETELILEYSKDVSEMMGRRVKVYYNDDFELIMMSLMYDDDIVADINAETFEMYKASTRKMVWREYRESNRWENSMTEKSQIIPQSADIIFNGRYTTEHTKIYEILESQNGYNIESIQLIASENNKKIDLLKITAYKSVIVKSADEKQLSILHDGNIGSIDYDESDPELTVEVVNTNGEAMKFGSIPVKSVISIFETLDAPKKVKIVVSTANISTMVTALDYDTVKSKVIAEGTEYCLSANTMVSVYDLKIGNDYTFYLDHCDRIAGYAIGVSDKQFLAGVVEIKKDFENELLNITVFNTDGKMQTLQTAKKWYINDYQVMLDENGEKMVYRDKDGNSFDAVQKIENEFLQFSLTSDGEIKKILTPKKASQKGEIGYALGMNNPETVLESAESNLLVYKSGSKYFVPDGTGINCMNFVAIDANTKIIQMPSKNVKANRDTYFSVLKPSSFTNDTTRTVIGYTMSGSDDIIADFAVVVSDSSSNPENGSVRVIKKISEAINNEEDRCYKLEVIDANGNEGTLFTESASIPEYKDGSLTGNSLALAPGDIIRFGVNARGHANAFILIYDESTEYIEEKNPSYWYASSRVVKGCVYNTDESKFTYVVSDSIGPNVDGKLQIGTAEVVIFFDKDAERENQLKVGGVSNLVGYTESPSNYSKVIIMTGYADMKTIFSYK